MEASLPFEYQDKRRAQVRSRSPKVGKDVEKRWFWRIILRAAHFGVFSCRFRGHDANNKSAAYYRKAQKKHKTSDKTNSVLRPHT